MTRRSRQSDRPGGLRTLIPLTLGVLLLHGATVASVSIYVAPETLARQAQWVVEADVVARRSGYDEQTDRLATYVTLEIDRVLRGEIDVSSIVIRELGGSYGRWVHETDASPDYQVGERVIAFLEQAPDGALRTSGMFFGKYVVQDDPAGDGVWAARQLDGRGTIRQRPANAPHRISLGDLRALVAATPFRARRTRPGRGSRLGGSLSAAIAAPHTQPLSAPPEHDRLSWEAEPQSTLSQVGERTGSTDNDALPQYERPDATTDAHFLPAELATPARWAEVDNGEWVTVHVDPRNNPLSDDAAAVLQIERGMTAWTDVPESRVVLKTGDTSFSFSELSPALSYSGTNIVLFDDPYSNISDPSDNCTGILAIGGYWRTREPTSSVHGLDFRGADQLYVIFNNDFDCVLGDADDLAEIATHELGHGLGFGHSSVPDAIMRSSAYRFRGPRLGDDDADAAHCFYPHRLSLDSPNGGESWESGSLQEITWSSTLELGPDPGVVDLEYSLDGGANWILLAAGQPNDGSHFWVVPSGATELARIRLSRPTRTGLTSYPFPARCSLDGSDGSFEITLHVPSAGAIPAGSAAKGGMVAAKTWWGGLEFAWGASCSTDATDYAIYSGSLDALRQGVWDHSPIVCSNGGQLSSEMTFGSGNRYFLVAPLSSSGEGRFGRGVDDLWRPSSVLACETRESLSTCE